MIDADEIPASRDLLGTPPQPPSPLEAPAVGMTVTYWVLVLVPVVVPPLPQLPAGEEPAGAAGEDPAGAAGEDPQGPAGAEEDPAGAAGVEPAGADQGPLLLAPPSVTVTVAVQSPGPTKLCIVSDIPSFHVVSEHTL